MRPTEKDPEREKKRDLCYELYLEAALRGEFLDPDRFLAEAGLDDEDLRQVLGRIYRLRRRPKEKPRGS
ncbi:MAG: hypothetical protein AB7O52_05625 [Planctomycetota bacterium]